MYARVFSSATGALAVTAALLLVMQLLITAGKEIIVEPRVRHDLKLVKVRDERQIITTDDRPARPNKPTVPPPTVLNAPTPEPGTGVRVPAPLPPEGGTTIPGISYGDGPLVNIFKVSPTYPSSAIARGLEGTVLVQYDVSAEGQVINVVVLESSHSVFEKPAVTAAYRFKYKPRVIDGVPYGANGLKNLFRFEMEE
ncbi:MAG: TonB family protein [Woeseiaceae bacterium]